MNENQINQLCSRIVGLYKNSDYPRRTFDFSCENLISLHVRVPPGFSHELLSEKTDYISLSKQFPCIEEIIIDPIFQCKGIFTAFVRELSNVQGVRAVVIGNVINDRFASALARKCEQENSGWSPYPSGRLPTFCFSSAGFRLDRNGSLLNS
jgi:hypothetical protein